MNYIMTALGIVIIMALACVFIMLCPILFNLFVIAIDEFLKLCKWLRHKVIMHKYDEETEMIISKARYSVLLEAFNILYGDEIKDIYKDETVYMDYDPKDIERYINANEGSIELDELEEPIY